jgi:DNA polymerase-3 subunit alpha
VQVTPPLVEKLSEALTHHRGSTEMRIRLQGARRTTVLRRDAHQVTPGPALFGDLQVLLGPACPAG